MLPWYFIEHIMTSKSKKSLKNANKYVRLGADVILIE
jgi:hypothetical protein